MVNITARQVQFFRAVVYCMFSAASITYATDSKMTVSVLVWILSELKSALQCFVMTAACIICSMLYSI
jgi:hypothetical protein